jgi:DNA-binding transcriptional LysR family regulator
MLHSRLLRYVDAVARTGSIRRAARELNVASSAVNRQIIAYEQELGTAVFERLPRGLRLTAAGEVVVEHVRETLRAHARLTSRLESLEGMLAGRVVLALTPGLADGAVPSIVARFIENRPGVQITIQTMPVERIAGAVLGGDADLGLGYYLLPNPGLQALMSFETRFGLVVAPGHPLALQTAVRLGDLVGHPVVAVEKSVRLRAVIDAAFARLSITLKPAVESNSVQVLKRLVADGSRVTLLNRLDVADDLAAGRLTFRPVLAPYLDPQPLALVARRRPDPLSHLFAEALRAELPKLAD